MFKRFLFLFLIAVSFQLNAIFPMNYFRYAERGLLLNWREKDDTSCLFFNMGPSEGGIKIKIHWRCFVGLVQTQRLGSWLRRLATFQMILTTVVGFCRQQI